MNPKIKTRVLNFYPLKKCWIETSWTNFVHYFVHRKILVDTTYLVVKMRLRSKNGTIKHRDSTD